MFGYVKPRRPELRVKEDELYRAAYCGLCRSMGKCTGCLSRMFLSYDIVFLLLARLALEGTEAELKPRRCFVHPVRPRLMMEPNAISEYCAVASVLLTCEKAEDDVCDSRGARRFAARGIRRILSFALRRAECPAALREPTKESLCRLSALEEACSDSVDDCADTFGSTLSTIFSYGLKGAEARIATELGYRLGRVLYVMDAVDDYEKDQKAGSYNPLRFAYPDGVTKSVWDAMKTALLLDLKDAAAAAELIDFARCRDVGNIIKNILYFGIPDEADRILVEKIRPKNQ